MVIGRGTKELQSQKSGGNPGDGAGHQPSSQREVGVGRTEGTNGERNPDKQHRKPPSPCRLKAAGRCGLSRAGDVDGGPPGRSYGRSGMKLLPGWPGEEGWELGGQEGQKNKYPSLFTSSLQPNLRSLPPAKPSWTPESTRSQRARRRRRPSPRSTAQGGKEQVVGGERGWGQTETAGHRRGREAGGRADSGRSRWARPAL